MPFGWKDLKLTAHITWRIDWWESTFIIKLLMYWLKSIIQNTISKVFRKEVHSEIFQKDQETKYICTFKS